MLLGGVGFQFDFDKGGSFFLAAGGWVAHPIPYMANNIKYTAIYVMSNPPVNSLLATVYAPGEQIPTIQTLGNSPVSGSTVAGISTLSNETNSAGTEVIDIGVTGAPTQKLIDIFNDHFVWSVLQSGVIHQVLSGNTSGNALRMGQAGDASEILGTLQIDGIAGTTLNGGTSGTAIVTQFMVGNLKLLFVKLSNFKTAASVQNLAFPTAFTSFCYFLTTDCGGMTLLASGIAQNQNVITTLGASGGSVTSATNFDKWSIGDCEVATDTIQFKANYNSAHSGVIIMLGV